MKNIKKIITAVAIAAMAFSVVGCSMIQKTQDGINKSVVAKFANGTVTRGEIDKDPNYLATLAQMKAQYGEKYDTNKEAMDALKTQKGKVLDGIVTEKILVAKATEMKVVPADAKLTEDTNKKFDDAKKSFNDDAKFADALKQQGFTEALLKEAFKKNIIIEALYNKVVETVKVSDEDVKKQYDTNQPMYTEKPNTVTLSHILVATEDVAKAVKARLDKGEDFAKVAKELSTDPGSKDKGGDLGAVDVANSGMDPEFMAGAMSLSKGQISAPIKTQFGFHIIKMVDKTNFQVKPFDKVKEDIKTQLLETAKQKEFQAKIATWKTDAKIETKKYEKYLV